MHTGRAIQTRKTIIAEVMFHVPLLVQIMIVGKQEVKGYEQRKVIPLIYYSSYSQFYLVIQKLLVCDSRLERQIAFLKGE